MDEFRTDNDDIDFTNKYKLIKQGNVIIQSGFPLVAQNVSFDDNDDATFLPELPVN